MHSASMSKPVFFWVLSMQLMAGARPRLSANSLSPKCPFTAPSTRWDEFLLNPTWTGVSHTQSAHRSYGLCHHQAPSLSVHCQVSRLFLLPETLFRSGLCLADSYSPLKTQLTWCFLQAVLPDHLPSGLGDHGLWSCSLWAASFV